MNSCCSKQVNARTLLACKRIINHACSIMVSSLCWQVVELRTPAKEGSDAFVSTNMYYGWWCAAWYWNSCSEYTYSVSFWNNIGENYPISSVSGPLPIDIPPLFTLLECTQLAGLLCTGSGIPPNDTIPEGAPPFMIGAGPCELPFLSWQVGIHASYPSWPQNLQSSFFSHIYIIRCQAISLRELVGCICF